jgi:hypothetical protein
MGTMPPQYRGIQGTWTKCLFNTKGPLYHTGALRKYGHDASSIQRHQGHLDRMPLHYRGTRGMCAYAIQYKGTKDTLNGYMERDAPSPFKCTQDISRGSLSTIQGHPGYIDRMPLHHTRAPQAIWRGCR